MWCLPWLPSPRSLPSSEFGENNDDDLIVSFRIDARGRRYDVFIPEEPKMEIRVSRIGVYLAVSIRDLGREVVLRRFPWPNEAIGRRAKRREALAYANAVGKVLLCPIEIEGLEEGAA